MKSVLLIVVLFAGLSVFSCNNQSKQNGASDTLSVTKTDSVKYTAAMVDNKRDPSCGMPVSAGIGDTAHYKNLVLGFCSKECKDEFLKNPEKNLAAADLKK
jgi:YHS domain-containing protein